MNVENMDTEVNADSMGNKSSLGECNQNSQDIIVLDVGGRQFFVFKSIFSTWPNSRLSYILFIYIYINIYIHIYILHTHPYAHSNRLYRLMRVRNGKEILKLCDGYYPSFASSEGRPEYFFDQNPENFNSILDMYRIGKLHRTRSTCALTYSRYLEYWGFEEYDMEPCCAIEYYAQKDAGDKEKEGEIFAIRTNQQQIIDENFGDTTIGNIRTFLWQLTEYPESSLSARVRNNITFQFYSKK